MKTIPTWGYKADEARIFDLGEGESLPSGWVDSPAKVGAVKAAPADPEPEPEAVVDAAPEPEAESGTDWRTLHWKQRFKLAKDLTGNPDIASLEEADAALEAHFNG